MQFSIQFHKHYAVEIWSLMLLDFDMTFYIVKGKPGITLFTGAESIKLSVKLNELNEGHAVVHLNSCIRKRIKQEPVDCDEEPRPACDLFQQQMNDNACEKLTTTFATKDEYNLKVTTENNKEGTGKDPETLVNDKSTNEISEGNVDQASISRGDDPSETASPAVRRSSRQRFPVRRLSTEDEEAEPNSHQKQSGIARMHPGKTACKTVGASGARIANLHGSLRASTKQHERAESSAQMRQSATARMHPGRISFRDARRRGASIANLRVLPSLSSEQHDIDGMGTHVMINDSNDVFKRRFRKVKNRSEKLLVYLLRTQFKAHREPITVCLCYIVESSPQKGLLAIWLIVRHPCIFCQSSHCFLLF